MQPIIYYISARAIHRARLHAVRNQTGNLYHWESGLDFCITIWNSGKFEVQECTHEALKISNIETFSDKFLADIANTYIKGLLKAD